MSTAAGAGFPSWVMLEPCVLRRDREREASFPDDTKAPIRVSGTTSCGDPFLFAFDLAEPPRISSLYAHLPAFGRNETPILFLSTHRHLALLRVGTLDYHDILTQDLFVFDASATDDARSLIHLPACTEPPMEYIFRRRSRRVPRRLPPPPPQAIIARPRRMAVKSMGLLCRGDSFAVAELGLYSTGRNRKVVYACIFLLKSSPADAQWDSMRVPILHGDHPDDAEQLALWRINAYASIAPVGRWLCWIDYCRGILFFDLFADPIPTVAFLRFPLDKFTTRTNNDRSRACSSWLYRRVSAVDDGRALKFVDVARHDGVGYGALKPGAGGFTVTCHTLQLGSVAVWNKETLGRVVWHKDWTVTSDELWSANPPERLPREALTFPQVNIDRPHVVHFLITEFGYVMKKMWVVAIDMSTAKVESCSQYVNGMDDIGTEGEKLTRARSMSPMPFIPCEFTKYLLHFPRASRSIGGAARDDPTAAQAIDPLQEFFASYNF